MCNVSRLFYSAYLENVQSDFTKHIPKWNSDLNVNLDKADFKAEFVKISTASICTNIRAFQYKFIHRIVKTNTFAFAINVTDSPLCSFCRMSDETVIHLFWECRTTRSFWDRVFAFILEKYDININFTMKDVILSCNVNLFNLLLLLG